MGATSDSTRNQRRAQVVAIVGPTASGKSALALRLHEHLPVEIVNADSRQVYRFMDIGTSKPSPQDRAAVPHHVLDIVEPDQSFTLAEYLSHARSAIQDIFSRGRIPLIVGGSGQYVWALVEGWQVPEVPPDPEFRALTERQAAVEGYAALHAELRRIDPEAAASIQPTNVRRVVRALELFRATGVAPSMLLRRRIAHVEPALILGLEVSRPVLYSRIDARIVTMMRDGFVDEVRLLLQRGYAASLPSMSSIGYREMADCVTGKTDLDTAIVRIGRETRRLVRRQHAWFSPTDERINWLEADEPAGIVSAAMELVAGAMR